MKKFNPNKNIIITLILVIAAITVLSVTIARRATEERTTMGAVIINDSIAFIDRAATAPVRWFENTVASVQDLFVTYEENQRLKAKLDSFDALVQENKNHQREIETLTEALELNSTLTSFDTTTANVITRSPDSWQDILVVDKGSNDGIEVNMAVMAHSGLVGRVLEVNAASSKVELLTSENQTSNHFPVRISSDEGQSFGVLSGFDPDQQLFIIEQLNGEAEIQEGDIVQTSGLGGNSPADLLVGTVVSAEIDRFGLARRVLVQPFAQTHDISVVTIVERAIEEQP